MANMRDIKRRIKSTKSTQQITKAMKMVSASKLRKAQEAVANARPYADKVEEVMANLLGPATADAHPYLMARPVKKVCYVLLSSDRGLCGGYNTQLLRLAEEVLRNDTREKTIMVVGTRGRDFLLHRDFSIDKIFTNVGDNPTLAQGLALSEYISHGYLKEEYDEVHFIYSEFKSVMLQVPVCKQVLPVQYKIDEKQNETEADYIFEPSKQEIIASLMPKYLDSTVYRLMLEAKAGEHGARMTAMTSATDNASTMIEQLTLQFNRARQAAITTEITEIVGGAAALQ